MSTIPTPSRLVIRANRYHSILMFWLHWPSHLLIALDFTRSSQGSVSLLSGRSYPRSQSPPGETPWRGGGSPLRSYHIKADQSKSHPNETPLLSTPETPAHSEAPHWSTPSEAIRLDSTPTRNREAPNTARRSQSPLHCGEIRNLRTALMKAQADLHTARQDAVTLRADRDKQVVEALKQETILQEEIEVLSQLHVNTKISRTED